MSRITDDDHTTEQTPKSCDNESVLSPLLPDAQPTKHDSLLSKAFAVIWNSCLGCAFTGAVFLTAATVAMTQLVKDGVSPFQAMFLRGILSQSVLVPIGYMKTGFIVGPADHNMKWMLLRGLFGACGFLFAYLAVVLNSMSEAALLNDTYPVLLALLSWIFGIESVDFLSWIGILGAVVSNVLIVRPTFIFGNGESVDWDISRVMGIFSSFACVTSIASGFMIVGKIDKKIPPIVIGNHAAMQLTLITIPFMVAGYPESIEWRPSVTHIGYYILGACGTINQVMIVRAFQIGPPIKAAMCSLVRVLLTVSSGVIFFSEKITFWHAIGGVLLLSSISLVIWRRDLAKQKMIEERLANEMRSDSSV